MKKITVKKEDLKMLEQQLAEGEYKKHYFDIDELIAKRKEEERQKEGCAIRKKK